mgnify:CR=1 FL=1
MPRDSCLTCRAPLALLALVAFASPSTSPPKAQTEIEESKWRIRHANDNGSFNCVPDGCFPTGLCCS